MIPPRGGGKRPARRSILVLAIALAGCGGSSGSTIDARFSPDVPTWRGGCVLSGAPGKIINGSPSPDLRLFGKACSDPPGPGGIIYLDRYDPVSGDGDVTVLSSERGATPVVVARSGGGGSIDVGSTGARLDDQQSRLLTLSNVSFVTGDLVVASLPAGTPARTVATGVRVGNYEFLGDGGALFVARYDARVRQGDLVYWKDDAAQIVASSASRFDFVMYRLAPDRARVAYLRGWDEQNGGDLFVQPLPPGPESSAPRVATGVYRMAWTDDGQLVFRTRNADGVTYGLWVWNGHDSPRQVATDVNSAQIVGADIVFATGWSVLAQRASLHMIPAAGGADVLGGAGPASLNFEVTHPGGSDGVLGYLAVPSDAVVPSTGDLFVTPLAPFAPLRVDGGVSIEAAVQASPKAGFLSYSIGFEAPETPGSANPQPGIARELKVAAAAGGTSFVLARDAATFVAWDPQDRFVAAVGSFAPAANRGVLVVRSAADGTQLLSLRDVGNADFGFAQDGSLAWAIGAWDDALRRGELVLAPTSGSDAWQPSTIAEDVTWVSEPTDGRVIYGVRGGSRDGIWLGGLR